MTLEQYEDLLETAEKVNQVETKWRKGQSVFNTMVSLYPEEAELVRGSSLDMFYDDENIKEYKKILK